MNPTNLVLKIFEGHTRLMEITDVTNCDLETKSILKPAKVRAPLQEVDLGLDNFIDKDVIRKRRVSFAGVNKIKEFNSKAESVIICSTPAYEETFSTSSDSSALVASVVKDDCTLLNDTMDLTDVQGESNVAMDMMLGKDSHFLASSGMPVTGNLENVPPNCDQTKTKEEKYCNKVTDVGHVRCNQSKPASLDPTKLLLKELLDDSNSLQDASMSLVEDNSVIGHHFSRNTVITNNVAVNRKEKHSPNIYPKTLYPIEITNHQFQSYGLQTYGDVVHSESLDKVNCQQPKSVPTSSDGSSRKSCLPKNYIINQKPCHINDQFNLLDMSEAMDFTEVLKPNVVNSNKISCQGKLSEDSYDNNCKYDNNMSLSLVELPAGVASSYPNPTVSTHNYNSTKNSNYTESARASIIPEKHISAGSSDDLDENKSSCQPYNQKSTVRNVDYHGNAEKPFAFENIVDKPQIVLTGAIPVRPSSCILDFQQHTSDTAPSQMEFTEAKLSSYNSGEGMSKPDSENPRNPSAACHNANTSVMEFTEAIPPGFSVPKIPSYGSGQFVKKADKMLSQAYSAFNTSQMEFTEAIPTVFPASEFPTHKTIPLQGDANISQMEFTEAIPRALATNRLPNNNSCEQVNSLSDLQTNTREGIVVQKPLAPPNNADTTQMDFTEAIPACFIKSNLPTCSNFRELNVPVCSNKPTDHNPINSVANMSQMDFTDALPFRFTVGAKAESGNFDKAMSKPERIEPPDHIAHNKDGNASQMEFTEAIPPGFRASNFPSHDSGQRMNKDDENIPQTLPVFQNALNLSQMEFTEAIPAAFSASKFPSCNFRKSVINGDSNGPQKNISHPDDTNISQMEFTEALPTGFVKSKVPSYGPGVLRTFEQPESQMPIAPLYDENESRMEFTEAIPSKLAISKPSSNDSNEQSRNSCEKGEFQKAIPSQTHANIITMELTEAIPSEPVNTTSPNYDNGRSESTSEKDTSQKPSAHTTKANMTEMEITEALPGQTALPNYDNGQTKSMCKNVALVTKANITEMEMTEAVSGIPSHDNGRSNSTRERVTSQEPGAFAMKASITEMEITEALPGTPVESMSPRHNNDRSKNSCKKDARKPSAEVTKANSTEMKITEAIPGTPVKTMSPRYDNGRSNGIFEKDYSQNHVTHIPKANMTEMEITEALTGTPVETVPSKYDNGHSKSKCERVIFRKSTVFVTKADITEMEVTEPIPGDKTSSPRYDCGRSQNMCEKYTLHKSNATVTQMEITEAIRSAPHESDSPTSDSGLSRSSCEKGVFQKPFDLVTKANITQTEMSKVITTTLLWSDSSNNDSGLSGSSCEKVSLQNHLGHPNDMKVTQLQYSEAALSAPANAIISDFKKVNVANEIIGSKTPKFIGTQPDKVRMEFKEPMAIGCTHNVPGHNIGVKASCDLEEPQKPIASNAGTVQVFTESTPTAVVESEENINVCSNTTEKTLGKNRNIKQHLGKESLINPFIVGESQMDFPPGNPLTYPERSSLNVKSSQNVTPIDNAASLSKEERVDTVLHSFKNIINEDDNINKTYTVEAGRHVTKQADCRYDKLLNPPTQAILPPASNLEIANVNRNCQAELRTETLQCNMEVSVPANSKFIESVIPCKKDLNSVEPAFNMSSQHRNLQLPYAQSMNYQKSAGSNNNESFENCRNDESIMEGTLPTVDTKHNTQASSADSCCTNTELPPSQQQATDMNDMSEKVFPTIQSNDMAPEKCKQSIHENLLNKHLNNVTKSDINDKFPLPLEICTDFQHRMYDNNIPKNECPQENTKEDIGKLSSSVCEKQGFQTTSQSYYCMSSLHATQFLQAEESMRRKENYPEDKSAETWNLIKTNRSFMTGLGMTFVSPTLWKYSFRWPLDLLLRMPLTTFDMSTNIENSSLVSRSSKNMIAKLADRYMRKNLSLILSEEFLNTECRTLKDMRIALKLVEEEYARLVPLLTSLMCLSDHFPFHINDFRLKMRIVNLKAIQFAEISINVSDYKHVSGKDITLTAKLGNISEKEVQKLFKELPIDKYRFVNLVRGVHRLLSKVE